MDDLEKAKLKAWLLHDVAYLCRRADRVWSAPIVRTLRDIREIPTRAVFFGGTLRSLLLTRVLHRRLGRPRDVDIVVEDATTEALRERFRGLISRETRFGGLQLKRMNWHFDVWPLHQTWAFADRDWPKVGFGELPLTTFFNLEAIAVDVWAKPGSTRTIYSANDQFFEGILSKTLELNYESNPFPALCIVRSLVLASSLDLSIGRRLARYLAVHGPQFSIRELEETQRKHYGRSRLDGPKMRSWIDHIRRAVEKKRPKSIKLPGQLSLWPDYGKE